LEGGSSFGKKWTEFTVFEGERSLGDKFQGGITVALKN
jgi:hypothetical protein